MDSTQELIDASELLVEAIQKAPVELAFTKEGNGPLVALVDHTWTDTPGPIRRAAARLRVALVGFERDRLARELAR